MFGLPDFAHAADAEAADEAVTAELLDARFGGAGFCTSGGHRAAHAHEVPREQEGDAERDRERTARGDHALALEPVGGTEQHALGDEGREVPIERSGGARALAADRRDRGELIAIRCMQDEVAELVERLIFDCREQGLERGVGEVLVPEQAVLLRGSLGELGRGVGEDRSIGSEHDRAGAFERCAHHERGQLGDIEIHRRDGDERAACVDRFGDGEAGLVRGKNTRGGIHTRCLAVVASAKWGALARIVIGRFAAGDVEAAGEAAVRAEPCSSR